MGRGKPCSVSVTALDIASKQLTPTNSSSRPPSSMLWASVHRIATREELVAASPHHKQSANASQLCGSSPCSYGRSDFACCKNVALSRTSLPSNSMLAYCDSSSRLRNAPMSALSTHQITLNVSKSTISHLSCARSRSARSAVRCNCRTGHHSRSPCPSPTRRAGGSLPNRTVGLLLQGPSTRIQCNMETSECCDVTLLTGAPHFLEEEAGHVVVLDKRLKLLLGIAGSLVG